MEKLESLVKRLHLIASKNKDEFKFEVHVEVVRMKLRYEFVARERADGHEFVSGRGESLDVALAGARAEITDACKSWDYVDPVPA